MTEVVPVQTEAPAPPSTPAEAATRLDACRADPKWTAALLSGNPEQTREFHSLHELVAKGDTVDLAMSGVMQPGGVHTSEHMEIMGTAEMLRGIGVRDEITKDVLAGTHAVTKAEYDATSRLKADKMSNPEWTKRLMAGDVEAKRELALINIILTGEIRESAA